MTYLSPSEFSDGFGSRATYTTQHAQVDDECLCI